MGSTGISIIECPIQKCLLKSIAKKKSFSLCKTCRLIFYHEASSVNYEDHYFFKEYRSQYGKNYLDDKLNIQKKMKERLRLLEKYISIHSRKRLLEIGSACGFFLELSKNSGFTVEGWEVSSFMSTTANKQGYFTRMGSFEELYHKWKERPKKFDILAAFYTIEHFQNIFLFWEAAKELLAPGGILLISVPSSFGPSYYFHKANWILDHPDDHFVDYSPQSLDMLGSFFSFRLLEISAEGIHPERFPLGSLSILKKVYEIIQKKYAFSDTIFAIFKSL